MPSETFLFDLRDVLVTNLRFTAHHRSFSLRSIHSLEVLEHGRSWRPAVALASLSLLSGLASVTTASAVLAVSSAGFFLFAVALFFRGAPHYNLAIHTEDGYFIPFASRDRALVEAVAKVLQLAAHHSSIPFSARAKRAASPGARESRPALISLNPRSSHALPAAHSIRTV